MEYVSFDNLPVYLSAPNTTTSPTLTEATARLASAQQVQFNYAPSIANQTLLG